MSSAPSMPPHIFSFIICEERAPFMARITFDGITFSHLPHFTITRVNPANIESLFDGTGQVCLI